MCDKSDFDSASSEGPPENDAAVSDTDLDRIGSVLDEIRAQLHTDHERATSRERVIDRLHEENQRLRTGERQLLLLPVLTDLCRLHDDLLRQSQGLPAEVTTAQMAGLLTSFASSVTQTLERCGVEALSPAVGDPFEPRLHRATDTINADHPDADSTIAELVTAGYWDVVAERTVRPATVRVALWRPPETPESAHA